MNNRKPLIVLGVVVVAAILVSILLSNQIRRTSTTVSEVEPEPVGEPTASTSEASPTPEPTAEFDLASSRRLSNEEAHDLYRAMSDRLESATSAVVRVRFELPGMVEGQRIEGEARYDRWGEMACKIETSAFQPKVKTKLEGEWEHRRVAARVVSSTGIRHIHFVEHKVYDCLFDTTMEEITKYTELFERQAKELVENPLQDLLAKTPLEDRLKEIVQATLLKSSKGNEYRIVSRITRAMSDAFRKDLVMELFPYLSTKFKEELALRTDTFDAETGWLKETLYTNYESKELLKQVYTEIELGEEVPHERRETDLPDPTIHANINEILEKKQASGIRYEDWLKAREAGEATGEIDFPLLPDSP